MLYRTPPAKNPWNGAPYTLPFAVTVWAKVLSRLPVQSPSAGTRVSAGLSAWNSDPELYMKTSLMSPVDNRVLTMLSPSPPCGRVSTFTVMPGFFLWNASASAFPRATEVSPLSTRKVIDLPSPPPPLPPLPQAARASDDTASPTSTAVERRLLLCVIAFLHRRRAGISSPL